MGSFYTSITVKTADTERVVAAVRQARRTAFISPAENDATVVFDEASESQGVEQLWALTQHLSRVCRSPALAILNHDDDVLLYFLFDAGELVDEYNSAPGYFDPDGDPDAPPAGGDSRRVAGAFGAPGREADVERILRAGAIGDDGFLFAVDRHRALGAALGLSAGSVGCGYAYIEGGDLPPGLDAAALLHVSGAAD